MGHEWLWLIVGEMILLLIGTIGYLMSREIKRRDDVASSVKQLSARVEEIEHKLARKKPMNE